MAEVKRGLTTGTLRDAKAEERIAGQYLNSHDASKRIETPIAKVKDCKSRLDSMAKCNAPTKPIIPLMFHFRHYLNAMHKM